MTSERRLKEIREDFPVLEKRRNGKPPVYLDNACTTLVPRQVIQSINEYYTGFPGCGGTRSRSKVTGKAGTGSTGAGQLYTFRYRHAG